MADITDKYKGITEGEWDVRELNTNLFHISSEHKHICVIADIGHETQEDIANARLIANSPMLLSQLNEAVELLRQVRGELADGGHLLTVTEDGINDYLERIGGDNG